MITTSLDDDAAPLQLLVDGMGPENELRPGELRTPVVDAPAVEATASIDFDGCPRVTGYGGVHPLNLARPSHAVSVGSNRIPVPAGHCTGVAGGFQPASAAIFSHGTLSRTGSAELVSVGSEAAAAVGLVLTVGGGSRGKKYSILPMTATITPKRPATRAPSTAARTVAFALWRHGLPPRLRTTPDDSKTRDPCAMRCHRR